MAGQSGFPEMKELDENTALGIVFANTKRKKRTADLWTIAEACEYLVELYGSQKTVAQKAGLSSETIRQFRKVLTLPKEVADMVRARLIDRLDVAYRISMLDDPENQVRVANQVAELSTDDVRDMKLVIAGAGLSPEAAKNRVLESKLKGLHVFVMDFDAEEYQVIVQQAKGRKMVPAELVRQVVLDWLAGQKDANAQRK